MAETAILTLSLKEYKKEIDDLKGSLLGLQKGSKEYESVLTEVRNRQTKLNEVMADSKRTSDVAANSMNALKAQLKAMKQEAGNLDIGSSRFKELTIQINETTEKLKDLEAQQGTFSRNVGNYESGVVSLKGQLKEITAQMAQMLDSGVKPTDAAFVELAKKAGDLKDAISDSQAVIKHFADDTKGLSTVIDLAKSGTAAFGVYKGALSLFGVENESVNQTMATMTSIMATLNSLQTLQTALVDRASITYRLYHGVVEMGGKALAFLGLTSKQTAASTVAETTATAAHTTAMVADTAATGAATVATNLFKKALIATGIGAIIVAIGTLVAHLGDLVDIFKSVCSWVGKATGLITKNTEAEKRQAEAAKRDKEFQEELAKTEKDLANKNVELIGTFETLKARWDDLDTVDEKRKFIERYKNEMNALGVEINNVNDAEQFFSTEGAIAFGKSIEIRAKLVIAQQKLVEKLKQIQKSEADDALTPGYLYSQKNLILSEITDLYKELEGLQSKYQRKSTSATTKTTRSTTTTKKETKEDISGDIEALTRTLDEQTRAYQHQYDMLVAMNKARLEDELETVTKIYNLNVESINKMIADRQKQLENTKITAEQRKQIEDEIYKYQQELIDKNNEYEIKSTELQLKLKQQVLQGIKENSVEAQKYADKNYQWYKDFYSILDSLMGLTPKEAKSIVQFFNIDEDTKNQLLYWIEEYGDDTLESLHDINYRIELDEYNHQIEMMEIKRTALEEIAIQFGKGSKEYITLKKQVDDEEERMMIQHYSRLGKIEADYIKNSKAQKKKTLNAYLDMGQGIGDIFSAVGNIMEEDIRNKQENGKITEEEAKKQFETVKAIQISVATIDTLAGAIGAFMGTWQDKTIQPVWLRGALAGVNAAAVTAAGVAQIAQIKSQQYGSSGSISSATGGATREATNIDFSGVSVNPLLDSEADILRMQTLSETREGTQQVVILQSDIADSMRQVEIRQSNTTF